MIIRIISTVVMTFFLVGMSHATSTIRTFSYETVFVANTTQFALDKVNSLSSSNRIYRGDIVYVRVKQIRGQNAHFRFDDAGGQWIPHAISSSDYQTGKIQERIMQELANPYRGDFFWMAHAGQRGFDIIGGGYASTWNCGCRVIITDITDEPAPEPESAEDPYLLMADD